MKYPPKLSLGIGDVKQKIAYHMAVGGEKMRAGRIKEALVDFHEAECLRDALARMEAQRAERKAKRAAK